VRVDKRDELPKDVPSLIALLKKDDFEVQIQAAVRLRTMKGAAKDAVPALTEILPKCKGILLRVILGALGDIGADSKPALPQIIQLMKADRMDPRVADARIDIRADAAHALIKIDSSLPEVVDAAKILAQIIQTEKESWDEYGAAVKSLNTIGNRAVPVLIVAYRSKR